MTSDFSFISPIRSFSSVFQRPLMMLAAFLVGSLAYIAQPVAQEIGRDVDQNVELAALPDSVQPIEELVFDVLMDGAPIGEHRVAIGRKGAETHIAVNVDLKVTFGPFTLFSYEQRNKELWRDGEIVRFEAATDNDGDFNRVTLETGEGSPKLVVNDTVSDNPSTVFPTTYWNIETVQQNQLLATLDGEIKEIGVMKVGREEIETGRGRIMADHYKVMGDLKIDIWYDDLDRWVKLAFRFKDNQFDYVLR